MPFSLYIWLPVTIGVNFGLTKHLEAGVYAGYGSIQNQNEYHGSTSHPLEYVATPSYGLNLNYHILPFWIQSPDYRLAIYVTGKAGLRHVTKRIPDTLNGTFSEISFGGGAAFYVFKRFGILGEYSFGNYAVRKNDFKLFDNVLLGLTFKL